MWSGTRPNPAENGEDGPLATPERALELLRLAKQKGELAGPVTVFLAAGRYHLERPLAFTRADSMPVTFAGDPERPTIIDGGRRITGWRETKVKGKDAWVTHLPEVERGAWSFKQLFVNDQRRPRPRLPKEGEYRIDELPGQELPARWGQGQNDRLRLPKGVMKQWHNLTDVEIVAFHWWIDERLPVASFDDETELITTSRKSWAPLVEGNGDTLAPCVIENVFEALTEPGEWYLDRPAGKLYYLPKPGETPENTEIYAPRLLQLLTIKGSPEDDRHVAWLRFENLRFEHTRGIMPGDPEDDVWSPWKDPQRDVSRHYRPDAGSSAQGAAAVPGAIQLRGAHHCSFRHCCFAHLGWYGVEIGDGCHGNRLDYCEIYDTGAGGVKINGGAFDDPPNLRTGHTTISDCHLCEGGRLFHSGIGILSMHSFGNTFSHNHIHDYYYSGISCGWVWGYAPSISRDNLIEQNHIHDLGQGLLSDMGGVYLLGVQPGTVVRLNHIHDITKRIYGAWCLYTDEGSSHILLEQNICYRTNGEIFHQHYGRENIVRNNIFAFGQKAVTAYTRGEDHIGLSLLRNILITHGPPVLRTGGSTLLTGRHLISEDNLFWLSSEPSGELQFQDRDGCIDLTAWRNLGHDLHSLDTAPGCHNIVHGDYSLPTDSPAWDLGFEPIYIRNAGPRDETD